MFSGTLPCRWSDGPLHGAWMTADFHINICPSGLPRFTLVAKNLFCIKSAPLNFGGCLPPLLFSSSTSYWSRRAVKLEENQKPFMLPHISRRRSNKHHSNVMNCTRRGLHGVPVWQVVLTHPWKTNLIDSGLVCQLKSCVSNVEIKVVADL